MGEAAGIKVRIGCQDLRTLTFIISLTYESVTMCTSISQCSSINHISLDAHSVSRGIYAAVIGAILASTATCAAADRFEPTEFGWKTVDSHCAYSGVYVNKKMAVAWSEEKSFYRTSTDAGNTWGAEIRPTLHNSNGPVGPDMPVQCVATTKDVYIRSSAGMVYDRSGMSQNTAWNIPQISRLEVTGNDMLVAEEGAGIKTHIIKNNRVISSMPGRIIFAFDQSIFSYDGNSAYASDGNDVRKVSIQSPSSTPPDMFPLSSGPGGEVMRASDLSRWVYESGAITRTTDPSADTTVLSFGHNDNGAGGCGVMLLHRTENGESAAAIFGIKAMDKTGFIDQEASKNLSMEITCVAAAGRDSYGWRYVIAGPEGLKLGRFGGPRRD